MNKYKYKVGEIVNNNFEVLELIKPKRYSNGAIVTYWKCKCLKCGKVNKMSTQQIGKYKSCGCEKYKRNGKVKNSGRKTPENQDTRINILMSIYKGNANKRNIPFELKYSEFEKLVLSNCHYCGDKPSNKLVKRRYEDLKYNGIDRINNEEGYSEDNCVTCCKWCNEAKNKHTYNYFIEKCIKVVKKHGIELDEKYFDIGVKRVTNAQ